LGYFGPSQEDECLPTATDHLLSLKAFLFQLKDFSSTVDARIMMSGRVELMMPDIPERRISFRVLLL
jgi:hypothetical protein